MMQNPRFQPCTYNAFKNCSYVHVYSGQVKMKIGRWIHLLIVLVYNMYM